MPPLWPVAALFLTLPAAYSQNAHGRDLWRSIASHNYAVPDGESAEALSKELSALLGSPDPELRDDLAYSILERWIARPGILKPETLNALADEWRGNLRVLIGESNTNSVLRRSFSALCLASIAARELRAPFLGEERYRAILEASLTYLGQEQDLRGYDDKLGWIHATAHTADVIEALARNKRLTHDEATKILAAVAHRLSTAASVYTQGEQDRLAAAVCATIRRTDFDPIVFEQWLDQIKGQDSGVWKGPLTTEKLAVYQNHTYTLQALLVRLLLEPDSPVIKSFREKVLAIVRTR